ncbi:MAG: hypothetical protein N2510_09175 [Ignavibacteria bacterium]|nr:hypothetical protein [Ignavibacteria bacterium]
MKFFIKLSLSVFLLCKLYSQDKITINYADSLLGKIINGEQVREAIGNVSLSHNKIKINCNRVIQYIDANRAELYGNVRLVSDTIVITASSGIYYGNEGKVVCPSGAILRDPSGVLKANYGVYYFINDLASFRGKVKVTDESSYEITCDEVDYYRNVQKSYAKGNVKIITDSSVIFTDYLIYEKLLGISTATGNVIIESDSTIITSDKAIYYDNEKKSIAEGKVKINFINENTYVYGDYAENYEKKDYSLIRGSVRLINLEKNQDRTDTTFIFSHQLESFRQKGYYYAKDSVKSIRNDFSSSSERGHYLKNIQGGGVISISGKPVVWKGELQLTGDSVYAEFTDALNDMYVIGSAFASQPLDSVRYDQVSGMRLHLNFKEDRLQKIFADTNSSAIYFISDNNNNPDGANLISGDRIIMYFGDDKLKEVKVTGKPDGIYYPESLVNPVDLRLNGFRIYTNKPVRDIFFVN